MRRVELNPRDEKTDFEELRGIKDGRIYRHGENVLAFSSDDNRLQYKVRDLLGVRRQPRPVNEWWGKEEPTHLPRAKTGSVVLFEDKDLDIVAGAIGAKKKRPGLNEKQKAALAPYQFKKNAGAKSDSRGLETLEKEFRTLDPFRKR
jgi:hypothetical protein